MAIYDTDLKKGKDGVWYRWMGENEQGAKQKFRLGKNKSEAKRRLRQIISLYETQVEVAKFYKCTWVPEYLKAAKEIAKGNQAKLPRISLPVSNSESVQESAMAYARHLAYLNRYEEDFQPESSLDFVGALKAIDKDQKQNRLVKSKLVGTNPDKDPTGQTVGEAIEGYAENLKTKATLPDKSLSAWGKKQIDQLNSWRNYIAEVTKNHNGNIFSPGLLEMDLSDLTVANAQQLVDATRKRPLSFVSNKTSRLAVKTASEYNKTIKNFFDWLDLSDEWQWWEPTRFRKLNYKVSPLTNEEKHIQKQKKDKWRLSDEEIKTLIDYATPVERVLILLGLNCAFGSGEIGNLRIGYVKFETAEINGIRFKTGNDTRHYLWKETMEALEWELQRREHLPKNELSKDIFFLSEKSGNPLWNKTKSGNYTNGVAKRWKDLIKRIQKDDPGFHSYSFGKLRKTAAIRVIEIANAEAASMILAHGIPSEDKLLSAYVNIPWEKLYKAQEAYGGTIRPLLKTDRPPFEQPPKNYIGKKSLQIIQLHEQGLSATQIASKLGISKMTVYRHIDRN